MYVKARYVKPGLVSSSELWPSKTISTRGKQTMEMNYLKYGRGGDNRIRKTSQRYDVENSTYHVWEEMCVEKGKY